MANASFDPLLSRMQELKDLSGVIGLCTWDQETYLPAKAEPARAAQLSTLQGLYHERLTSPELGELLDKAAAGPLTDDQRAMIRVLSWERARAIHVPKRLVQELAEAQSHALALWREARKARTFSVFRPGVEKLLAIRREQADAIGFQGERYDALLDAYEPGMTVARLSPVLTALREKLVPIVRALTEAEAGSGSPPKDVLAGKTFDVEAQWRYTMELLEDLSFDLGAGRQDRSIHPFTGSTHPLDVRLTTKLVPETPFPAVFGTIHECGHGLYEQGFSPEHFRTPLAAAPSMGLHESQSRLWENIVGRSRAFWVAQFPKLQAAFPTVLADVTLDGFVGAVNRVEPSLIRTEADEVTYNLHIVLRYELELALIRGELKVADLPGEWNARMQRFLGITPAHDTEGVLQDIHWAWGELGYFPTYSLGNLYSASLWRQANRDVPGMEERISRGDVSGLRGWLREKIHSQGFRHPAEELVTRITGRGITDEDFIAYLKQKYSALYRVQL